MRDSTSANTKPAMQAQPRVLESGRGGERVRRLNVSVTDPVDPQPSISLRLHGGNGAPLRARRSVLPQLDRQLTETGAADVALILSELVTNSVVHANVGPDETLTVECTALPDRLRITVTDPGSRLEPRRPPPNQRASGGYGLMIVERLCSAWGVVRSPVGTTSVWCELPLDTASCDPSTDREHRNRPAVMGAECLRHRTSPEQEEAR
jgi:anti-sigma regulatory factor (Ser/Thr protein kinase)